MEKSYFIQGSEVHNKFYKFLSQLKPLIEASRYGGTNTLIPIQISRTVNKGVYSSREDIFGKEI